MANRSESIYVYVVGPIEGFYKIGRTNDPDKRLLSLHLPIRPTVFRVFKCCYPEAFEYQLHRHFAHCRGRGEWFRLTAEDLETIDGLAKENAKDDRRSGYQARKPSRRITVGYLQYDLKTAAAVAAEN